MAELGTHVGLDEAKGEVEKLANQSINDLRRREHGIEPPVRTRHMLFLGNPGSGKTTVAKVVATMLHAIGAVPTDKFKLYDSARAALVANYVGETTKLAQKVITGALDGVLFLDEVCSQ